MKLSTFLMDVSFLSLSDSRIISIFLQTVRHPRLPSRTWSVPSPLSPAGRPLPVDWTTSCSLVLICWRTCKPFIGLQSWVTVCLPLHLFRTGTIWSSSCAFLLQCWFVSFCLLFGLCSASSNGSHCFRFSRKFVPCESSAWWTKRVSVLLIVLHPHECTSDAMMFTWQVVLANEFPAMCTKICVYIYIYQYIRKLIHSIYIIQYSICWKRTTFSTHT